MPVLQVPALLWRLVESGRWTHDTATTNAQNDVCLATPARIASMAPEENRLCLYPPPFFSVQTCIDRGESEFWMQWAPPLADPARCLVIGDFGLGSDAPILLDYSNEDTAPCVVSLRYAEDQQKQWVLMAQNFESFVGGLGL